MNGPKDEALKLAVAAGLEKCLHKLTEVSPGAWELAGARVFSGQVRDAVRSGADGPPPAAALRVKIKGPHPFTTAFLFDPRDTGHISSCFADGSFYGLPDPDQPEVTIIEIGNIVLNALSNAVLRTLGHTAVPSVPAYFKGDPGAIEQWLGSGPGVFLIAAASLTMRRDSRSAGARIMAFIPPALAAEIP